MRGLVSVLSALVLLSQAAAFVLPWHQGTDPYEFDDGEHLWGDNVVDESTWIVPDGDSLRIAAFYTAIAAVVFSTLAFAYAIGDRRLGTLTWTWFGALAWGGAAAMFLVSLDALRPGAGLFAAGSAALLQLLNGFLGIGVGSSRRNEAYA